MHAHESVNGRYSRTRKSRPGMSLPIGQAVHHRCSIGLGSKRLEITRVHAPMRFQQKQYEVLGYQVDAIAIFVPAIAWGFQRSWMNGCIGVITIACGHKAIVVAILSTSIRGIGCRGLGTGFGKGRLIKRIRCIRKNQGAITLLKQPLALKLSSQTS